MKASLKARPACPTRARIFVALMLVRTGAIAALASLAMVTLLARGAQVEPAYDVIIRNGTIADGSGAAAAGADLAVKNGRIAHVGAPLDASARETIDAAGLVVAPGFIDIHTHADDLAERPLAENFLRMGVTTIVAGNCGGSAVRVGDALAEIARVGASINFATLVGHNSVRREVMGTQRRAPTPQELDRMRALVARAMMEGAVGFSTGLQYVPGTYADTAEIVELAKVAAAAGGLYASHMRNEGTEIEKAVAETIQVGEAAHCPVQISHLKIDAPSRWGASAKALALIDAARTRGVDATADQYVYTAASSTLGIRFPAWALEGGQSQINERLDSEASWQRIKQEMVALINERGLEDYSFAVVASYKADPSLNGLSIKQIAAKLERSESLDAQLEVMCEMLRAGGASMVYHFMSEDDIARIMRHPDVAFASDSSVLLEGEGVPHPRGYGNNARVLGLYVRDKQIIPLEEAVRKMTSLPASHFRFNDRGLIKPGYAADLVLFDPKTVSDPATFDKPHAFAAGIPYVLVNGVLVIKNGLHTGAKPGSVLKGPAARPNSQAMRLRLVGRSAAW